MKTLDWIAKIAVGMGFLFILLGLIQGIIGQIPRLFKISPFVEDSRLFGDTEIVNFFIASTNFFIMAIALFIIIFIHQYKKD